MRVPGASNICFSIADGRGDTLIGTSRTPDYAHNATLRLHVTDDDDRPVDGAVVSIFGNWSVYGYPDEPAWASEGTTDANGDVDSLVGEGNPYGWSVGSAAGTDPDPGY